MELNFLEIFGTIVGLVYLWLEYRASIYLWIAGIVMPAIYIFVYYKAGLYADLSLIHISAKTIYGGSYNLLAHTLPSYGITTTFVDPSDLSNFEKAIQENTKAVFIETLGNPNSNIIDIEAVAEIAHRHKIPLIIDNTFGTPYLIRPIEHGADIVVPVSYTHLMECRYGGLGKSVENRMSGNHPD